MSATIIANAIYALAPLSVTLGLIAFDIRKDNSSFSDEEAARLAGELDALLASRHQH